MLLQFSERYSRVRIETEITCRRDVLVLSTVLSRSLTSIERYQPYSAAPQKADLRHQVAGWPKDSRWATLHLDKSAVPAGIRSERTTIVYSTISERVEPRVLQSRSAHHPATTPVDSHQTPAAAAATSTAQSPHSLQTATRVHSVDDAASGYTSLAIQRPG